MNRGDWYWAVVLLALGLAVAVVSVGNALADRIRSSQFPECHETYQQFKGFRELTCAHPDHVVEVEREGKLTTMTCRCSQGEVDDSRGE